MRKPLKPETVHQAQCWEKTKAHYLSHGLCHACAAQAAWGHQLGFGYEANRPWGDSARIKPPCAACAPVVAMFPAGKLNGWRAFPRGDRHVPGDTGTDAPSGAHRGNLSVATAFPVS